MQLTPVRINQIVSKKPKDPITSDDWNDILNLLLEQGNALSDQFIALNGTIATEINAQINQKILDGTLQLTNIDATTFGGFTVDHFISTTDLTELSTNISNTYVPNTTLNTYKSTVSNTYATITALSTTNTNLTNLTNTVSTLNTSVTTNYALKSFVQDNYVSNTTLNNNVLPGRHHTYYGTGAPYGYEDGDIYIQY